MGVDSTVAGRSAESQLEELRERNRVLENVAYAAQQLSENTSVREKRDNEYWDELEIALGDADLGPEGDAEEGDGDED